ncbi:MAG TPA: carboxypeptidase regulatory-like domain-containing protein [Gemmatimonadaceae bacterium]|nr:carboxypeptidase regulatory-like domain-containing protein [Gemmatimonadaceae bacterium]
MRAIRSFLLALVLVLVARPLTAQDPPVLDTVRVRPTLDTVVGTVYDSLAGEPLQGAVVVALPSGTITVTDSLGHFRLYTDTVATQVTVYHGVLDQLGLGALVAPRPADRRRALALSTPSFPTVWRSLCDSPRPLGGRTVIVTGTARLADGNTRVAGASVIAQWPKPDYATGGANPRSREVRTDSLGNFLICGIEDFVEVSFAAVSREYESGVITVPSDVRSLRRVDLVLGSPNERGALRGVVRNRNGAPLADIQLALDGADEPVTTGADGRFAFPEAPLGSRMLWVRAIGYQPVGQLVEVRSGETPPLDIPFDRIVELEGVTVTEKRTVRLERQEFDLRKRAGFGRVIEAATLASFPNVRAAIQTTPGVIVQSDARRPTSDFVILGRNGCRAYVYLDGTITNNEEVNRIPQQNIAAIEFYTNVAFAPSRYQPLGDNCAVVLFWTKYGLRP